MQAGAADTELIELIGAIYDAVIDKTLWPLGLERLCQRFEFEMAVLAVQAFPRGNFITQVAVNTPPDYAERLPSYNEDIMAIWGGPARMAAFPLEEPLLNTVATERALWENNRFYREWVQPLDIVDQVGVILARDRTVMGTLGLSIHARRPPFTEADLDELRLITPHLRRAVTISRMLDVAIDSAITFEAALEATTTGVILVEPTLAIIHANAAAGRMLAAGDPVRSVRGGLLLREELFPGQLRQAVETAARDETDLARRGMAIPTRLMDGTAAALSILPLERRRVRGGAGTNAAAAVFIADPAEPPSMPADAMRLLYNLTPAEQRVFGLVAEGRSTADIARLLGVGAVTVRTQLLRVFEKTGRRSRVGLVRLSQSLTSPV